MTGNDDELRKYPRVVPSLRPYENFAQHYPQAGSKKVAGLASRLLRYRAL